LLSLAVEDGTPPEARIQGGASPYLQKIDCEIFKIEKIFEIARQF
jgi:hypothetical protein